jgi:hypothetical protein
MTRDHQSYAEKNLMAVQLYANPLDYYYYYSTLRSFTTDARPEFQRQPSEYRRSAEQI